MAKEWKIGDRVRMPSGELATVSVITPPPELIYVNRDDRVRILCDPDELDAAEPCSRCLEIGDGFGPSHSGSPNCKSGSIASGGKQAHCACDTCF